MVCVSHNSHKQSKAQVASKSQRQNKLSYKTPLKEDIRNTDYEKIPSEDVECEKKGVVIPSEAHEPSDSEHSDTKKGNVQLDVIENPIPKVPPGLSRVAVVDIGTALDVSKDIPDYCAFIADVLKCQHVYVVKYDNSKELVTVHLLCDTDDVGKTSIARLKARQQGTFQLMWEDDARDNGYIY